MYTCSSLIKRFYSLLRIDTPVNIVCLFCCLVSKRPHQHLDCIADRSQDLRLTILRAATRETEQGDHDFCLRLCREKADF